MTIRRKVIPLWMPHGEKALCWQRSCAVRCAVSNYGHPLRRRARRGSPSDERNCAHARKGRRGLPRHLRTLTKRQQNQPLMVNALLSVVVYFLLVWHRVTVSFQVA